MDDYAMLLKEIRRRPDDDALLWAFADCLQEMGQEKRAEYVRHGLDEDRGNSEVWNMLMEKKVTPAQKASALFEDLSWRKDAPPFLIGLHPEHHRHGVEVWTVPDPADPSRFLHQAVLYYYRGVAQKLVTACSTFVEYAGLFFRDHPVPEVRLLGVWPIDGRCWVNAARPPRKSFRWPAHLRIPFPQEIAGASLPEELFLHLRGGSRTRDRVTYLEPTGRHDEFAIDSLQKACRALGEEKAEKEIFICPGADRGA